MSKRFRDLLGKVGLFERNRRTSSSDLPRLFFTSIFERLLEQVDDPMLVENLCAVLAEDPGQPKDGHFVDGTKCHKTYMKKGKRAKMLRVIHYHRKHKNEVYYLFVYEKSGQEILTADQVRKINEIVDLIEIGKLKLTPLDEESFE